MDDKLQYDPLGRAGLVSLGALVLLGIAICLAFYDLSNSNKPHELRFETLVFAMMGLILALAVWTIVLLVAAYRNPRKKRWTGRDRASVLSVVLLLGFPIYMPALAFFFF